MVRQLQGPDEAKAEAALATLCETYWYPIYAFGWILKSWKVLCSLPGRENCLWWMATMR